MLVDWIALLPRPDVPAPLDARWRSASAQLSGAPLITPEFAGGLHWAVQGNATARNAPAGDFCWRCPETGGELLFSGMPADGGGASRLLAPWSASKDGRFFAERAGGFSAAWYEPATGCLRAARDAVGHEPLYYIDGDDYFALSTSFKALRALLDGRETPDEAGIADYLALTHHDQTRTLLAEIRRLPPGHQLTAQPGQPVQTRRYWSLDAAPRRAFATADDCHQAFRQTVIGTVQAEAAGASQVGLMLSGGLDSSSLGAAYYQTETGQASPLLAFGSTTSQLADGDGAVDETAFMAAFVRHFPQTRLATGLAAGSMIGDVAQNVARIGFPHRDIYFYELDAMVQRAAAAGCDLLLTGLGGDFYASAKLGDFYAYAFVSGQWRTLARQARSEYGPLGPTGWAKLLARQVARPLLKRARQKLRLQLGRRDRSPGLDAALLNPAFAARSRYRPRANAAALAMGFPSLLRGPLYADRAVLDSGVVSHMLEYVAALGRAHGVRVASPLLDKRVVEFAALAPLRYRRTHTGQRSLLRRGFAPLLPPEIATRTSKGNFVAVAEGKITPDSVTAALRTTAECEPLGHYIAHQKLKTHSDLTPEGGTPGQRLERLLSLYIASGLAHFLSER